MPRPASNARSQRARDLRRVLLAGPPHPTEPYLVHQWLKTVVLPAVELLVPELRREIALKLLRQAGCQCARPLIGERPGQGPMCRYCGHASPTNEVYHVSKTVLQAESKYGSLPPKKPPAPPKDRRR